MACLYNFCVIFESKLLFLYSRYDPSPRPDLVLLRGRAIFNRISLTFISLDKRREYLCFFKSIRN